MPYMQLKFHKIVTGMQQSRIRAQKHRHTNLYDSQWSFVSGSWLIVVWSHDLYVARSPLASC